MVFRARCCNPIRGEKIVGYITRGKGVSVHSANCPNVLNLQYDPERRIDVEWDKGADAAPYTVRLTMSVEDRKGMMAELSSRIADINTNIMTLEATTGEPARAHRHDGRDPGHEAPGEGDQVDPRRRRGAGGRAGRYAALTTFFERMHRVQTRIFLAAPPTTARTVCRLGSKRRGRTLCAWDTRRPTTGPLPQIEQRIAILTVS